MREPERFEDNPYAPPDVELLDNSAWEPIEGFLGHGGFWRRFFAFWVDYFVLLLLLGAWSSLMQIVRTALRAIGVPNQVRDPVESLMFFLSVIALPIIYFAGAESSRFQATLGKRIFGMKVTNLQGGPISFWRAFGRLCGKFLSAVILYIGFLMVAFTPRKQGLHDMLAGTLVVKAR